jgi:hypothetical protein
MTADLRYPIGPFVPHEHLTPDERSRMLDDIANTPARMREAVAGLSESQLDTAYREGGWSVRQVVHHVPDSHLNAYIRLKLALTEDEPTIKPYAEDRWAELEDSRDTPIEISLTLLESLHSRWMVLLRALDENDFRRKFRHPEHGSVTLDWLVAMYSWHGRHHTGHITSLRQRMGW